MEEGFLFKAFSDQVTADWQSVLLEKLNPGDFEKIESSILRDYQLGKRVFPPVDKIFNAFSTTPLNDVKCVILGQDPYHQPNQAMGLSFSVPDSITIPPSLRNIFIELEDDLGFIPPKHGDLTKWAHHGVLLLNSILTVLNGSPLSHQNIGWEQFVSQVLVTLSNHNPFVVFVLWGKSAQRFEKFIDKKKHKVIKGVHPSPLSAHRGFFGSKPFSEINDALLANGKSPIVWAL